jgi:hypothetical protein
MKLLIAQCKQVIQKKQATNARYFQQVNGKCLQHIISFLIVEVKVQGLRC